MDTRVGETVAKTLAVGLAVFTMGLAAFVAAFTWWLLVGQPGPSAHAMRPFPNMETYNARF